MIKTLKRIGLALAVMVGMTGCSYINDGNFGLVQGWDNRFKNEVVTDSYGIYWIDTLKQVYGKDQVFPLELSPKDKNQVRLDRLKMTVTYRVLPAGAYRYVTNNGNLIMDKSGDYYLLGADRLPVDLAPSVQQVTEKWTSEEMYRDTEKLAKELKEEMQKDANAKYGADLFLIVDVKVPLVDVADFIENKIAQIQIQQAEVDQNAAKMAALASRNELVTKETNMLSGAVKNSGLTADQYLEYRWQETLSNMNTDLIASGRNVKGDGASGGVSGAMPTIIMNVGKR